MVSQPTTVLTPDSLCSFHLFILLVMARRLVVIQVDSCVEGDSLINVLNLDGNKKASDGRVISCCDWSSLAFSINFSFRKVSASSSFSP